MGKKFKKRKPINIEMYNRLIKENGLILECIEKLKKKFELPVKSILEIGTGTSQFATKFLIESERAKLIEKFYGMEPVDELFEESKKYVVRLSRTDATSQDYFGGNPFDIISFSLVFSHITDDKKKGFIKHAYNNLRDGGKLIAFETFIPDYTNQEQKEIATNNFLKENIKFFKSNKNDFIMNYFYQLMNEEAEDYIFGEYKYNLKTFKDYLENVGFNNIKIEQHKGTKDFDWGKMGYYIITADKE
ncbi:class I SAM-dependent methyltransferase [Candidatus Dojkabacteria bacterium]|nr:class I SAM-dependent methyltransferase [Candidatus Dojkabacteria bacterium]